MSCLIALVALIGPRVALVFTWLFSNMIGRAIDGVLVAVLGFLLLPWTTLAYVVFYDVGAGREVRDSSGSWSASRSSPTLGPTAAGAGRAGSARAQAPPGVRRVRVGWRRQLVAHTPGCEFASDSDVNSQRSRRDSGPRRQWPPFGAAQATRAFARSAGAIRRRSGRQSHGRGAHRRPRRGSANSGGAMRW